MRNPFVSYSPVDTLSNWVGSTVPFDLLSQHIHEHNNVCILGVQGCGKTSLLQCFFNNDYVKKMAQDKKTIICKVDLSLQQSGDDVCQYLVDRIRSTVRILMRGTSDYKDLVDTLAAASASDPMGLLQCVIEELSYSGYHVVLVMDRFENFTASPSITMGHHEKLRSLIEANMLRCIVATDTDLSKDSLAPGVKGSYLMQKFTNYILLEGMSDNATLQYIQFQQQESEIQLPEETIKKLTEISGGIPLLLEFSAESAFANLAGNGGKINGKELTAAIYERARPILRSWCSSLTDEQIKVLKTLTKDATNNKFALFDFTGFGDDTRKAVDALCGRGLLIAPSIEYKYEVRANSLLLQRYCKNELTLPQQSSPANLSGHILPKLNELCEHNGVAPSHGGNTIHIHVSGDLYQGNATNQSSSLTVQNMQINQGLSTSDLLQLICGSESAVVGSLPDSRGIFASQLSSQLRKYIPSAQAPFLLPDKDTPEHIYAQAYDAEFDKISQKLVCDVEVDEDEDLVVTPAELKTLESRFAEARTRCRTNLTDELLSSQSERCQFYIKLSVIVEDALELPGIQMDDYSPQLVLYGKALEQSLRDNFYELFHKELKLSIFSTYTQLEDRSLPDVFANKQVNQTLIGNYIFLMSAKRSYLATLCQSNSIQTVNQPSDNDAWIIWWRALEDDIYEARRIRNMADHADAVLSPRKENLELMCELLFGTPGTGGLLTRSLVGKCLTQQLFPPTISIEVANKFVGQNCRMICTTVKRNGGLSGITCEGGYAVNISPKRAQTYRAKNMCEDVDFTGKEMVILVLESKTQDNREFFGAEIVSICT